METEEIKGANIVLDYRLRIFWQDQVLVARAGAEVFLDEQGVQWIKFIASNGYMIGCETMVRTDTVLIVREKEQDHASN